MCVVAIYCRVTRVTAHMFVPSTNKHKYQRKHLYVALGFTQYCTETKELLERIYPLVRFYIVCAIKFDLFIFLHSLRLIFKLTLELEV